jgi:hypothetical protein
MEETILTWNVTNWITVVIMAALGFLLLALVAQVFHKVRGTSTPASQYSGTPAATA